MMKYAWVVLLLVIIFGVYLYAEAAFNIFLLLFFGKGWH